MCVCAPSYICIQALSFILSLSSYILLYLFITSPLLLRRQLSLSSSLCMCMLPSSLSSFLDELQIYRLVHASGDLFHSVITQPPNLIIYHFITNEFLLIIEFVDLASGSGCLPVDFVRMPAFHISVFKEFEIAAMS